MTPDEKLYKQKNQDDRRLVSEILKGGKQAWDEFVNHYTDWVFYTAYQWTKRAGSYHDKDEGRVIKDEKTDMVHTYPEETHDAYIWIIEQLKNKLKFYTGKQGASLSTYIWTVLNSNGFKVDYLRWKYGDPRKIPMVLKEASEQEKTVFILMRQRKAIEQIAAKLDVALERANDLTRSVLEKLIKNGLAYMVMPHYGVELSENIMDNRDNRSESRSEDITLFYQVCAEYRNAVNELHPEEQLILRLFFNEELSAQEVLDQYRNVKRNLPGGIDPEKIKTSDIYHIKNQVSKKLMDLFRMKCENLKGVVINNETEKIFLDQLGVQFEF